MYGWCRYESRFALPMFNEVGEIERYNVFNVIMVIRHAKDGKMYLYEIMNIKKKRTYFGQKKKQSRIIFRSIYLEIISQLNKPLQ